VWNLLLQILDHGTLTDGKGRPVRFRGTHVILTSNIGGDRWRSQRPGFERADDAADDAARAVEALFPPELMNRIDDVIVFEPLNSSALTTLLERHLAGLNAALADRAVTVTVADAAQRQLVARAVRSQLGARALERELRTELDDAVVRTLAARPEPGTTLTLEWTAADFALTADRSTPTPTVRSSRSRARLAPNAVPA
jgi:ATP-dependent Clp protease ATP-binding subunit ClpB